MRKILPGRDVSMARSFTLFPGRMLVRGGMLCVALLLSGCFTPQLPPTRRPAPAPVEQTASDATAAAADCPTLQQQLERLGVSRWHALGYRGQGRRVGGS